MTSMFIPNETEIANAVFSQNSDHGMNFKQMAKLRLWK